MNQQGLAIECFVMVSELYPIHLPIHPNPCAEFLVETAGNCPFHTNTDLGNEAEGGRCRYMAKACFQIDPDSLACSGRESKGVVLKPPSLRHQLFLGYASSTLRGAWLHVEFLYPDSMLWISLFRAFQNENSLLQEYEM